MKNKKHYYRKLVIKIFGGLLSSLIIIGLIGYAINRKQRTNFLERTNTEMLEHDLSINKLAPVTARQEIVINAPIKQVWNKLTSIKDWPKWQLSINSTKINSFPYKGVSFTWISNGITFHSIIHTNHELESFGWIGTTWGAQAIHNWYFIEKGNRTIVIVEESLQGLLVNIFSHYFENNVNKGMNVSLKELKISCEL